MSSESTKHITIMKSDTGDISVFDESDNFMASFKNGEWIGTDVFSMYSIYNDFTYIDDDQEKLSILKEARSKVGKSQK